MLYQRRELPNSCDNVGRDFQDLMCLGARETRKFVGMDLH